MPDPDTDTEPERTTDPRFDQWPIERYEGHEDWPVERATPGEGTDGPEDLKWIGVSGTGAGGAFFYSPERDEVHEGRFDDENERFVVDEESARRSVGEDETLGDHLVDFGEEHGWGWLSSFARDHMETHDHDFEEESGFHRLPPGFEHRSTKFQQRNVADSADVEVAFHGTHTFEDDTDRVHVLEREFGVDATDTAGASVTVEERYLLADEPVEESRRGDATLVDRRNYEFRVDVDTSEPQWENALEGDLQRWHQAHLAPPLKTR